jgi:hypothetical protein
MKTLIKSAVLGSALVASLTAQAVVITFGGVNPGDGSFLTSTLTPTNNLNAGLGIFNETFDGPNGGCQVNSAAQGIEVTGNFWLTTGSGSGIAAAPANDSTCYASGPALLNAGGGNTATIDWTNFLANNLPGKKIKYLGLYWGSIDGYNDITFYAQGQAINISAINGTALNKTSLNGADILQFGGNSGDRQDPNTNRYVNLWFDENEQFDKLVFSSNNYAFEIDNVVIQVAGVAEQVPLPAPLTLFGLGLTGLLWRRRQSAACS